MNENDLIYSFAKEHVIRASGLVALMMPQTLGAGIAVKAMDRPLPAGQPRSCNSISIKALRNSRR